MHLVKCFYCGQTFDRDIEKYSLVRANRYAHANCMLQKAEEDPKYEKKEIIDPSTTVLCCKCKKSLNKMSSDCICIVEGKYICSDCENKENKREKTDQEKLDDYIMQLFKTEYVDPKIKKQIIKHYIIFITLKVIQQKKQTVELRLFLGFIVMLLIIIMLYGKLSNEIKKKIFLNIFQKKKRLKSKDLNGR